MTIGDKIKSCLESRKLTEAQLVEALGVHPNRVYSWLLGRGEPKASQAARIARFLDVDLESLCDDTQELRPRRSNGS